MGYLEKMRKTIWGINEKEFESLLGEGFAFSLTYFAMLLAIGSAASFAVAFASSGSVVVSLLAMALGTFTYAFGIGLVLPLVSHFMIGLFGGKRPVTDTFQMYFYASTPSLLLGWVPCVGGLTPFVSFGNAFRGLREINRLGFWQAAAAVLLPALVYWGLWVALIFGLMSFAC
ncbi:MAG: YIP1 family protein [Candidatus Micrarchaeota archaeon]